MPTFSSDRLRNVVFLGHTGSGKTTLGEALLFATGTIPRMGRVEDGNTVADYEPEAVKRKGSVQLALLPCVYKEHKITFIDTPGYFDFTGEVISALRAADAAILCVAANAGVEVITEQMWERIQALHLPCLICVTKMDRENADFSKALASIQQAFGRHCVAYQVPIGAAQTFKGIVPLLPLPEGVPDQVKGVVEQARERLVEAIAETDDALATKYLEGEAIADGELQAALKAAVLQGKVVPVLVGSAIQGKGIGELLEAVLGLLPSPLECPPMESTNLATGQKEALRPDPSGPLAAFVFKTTADPYVGKLSLFRVFSGTFTPGEIYNASKGQSERVGQVFILRGKNQEAVPSLVAGEIGAVTKLQVTATGDTLCNRDHPLALPSLSFPGPLYSLAVYPKTKADLDKLGSALTRLAEEDPTLRFSREPGTGEALLQGMGDAHLDVALQRAQRKFGVGLVVQPPKVPYKETVASRVERVESRYKKQTGGHGHYAHIVVRIEPLPRGGGLEFAEEVVGGVVPKEFIPAVEKGVKRAAAEGVVAGYPVTDLRVVLFDGSSHPVDSASGDFEIAGYEGLRKGVLQANPVLLEPIMRLAVTVPDQYSGDVIGDLNGKRGRILGMTPFGNGKTQIEALVPLVEVQRYVLDLRSLTQGRGIFTIAFDHYEELPPHLAQKVIEQARQARAEAR
ncbi:MAG: elongation factor G [Dehalococcoidia bacterium]